MNHSCGSAAALSDQHSIISTYCRPVVQWSTIVRAYVHAWAGGIEVAPKGLSSLCGHGRLRGRQRNAQPHGGAQPGEDPEHLRRQVARRQHHQAPQARHAPPAAHIDAGFLHAVLDLKASLLHSDRLFRSGGVTHVCSKWEDLSYSIRTNLHHVQCRLMCNGMSIGRDPGWSSLSAAAGASHSWPCLLSVRTHVGPCHTTHWPKHGSD